MERLLRRNRASSRCSIAGSRPAASPSRPRSTASASAAPSSWRSPAITASSSDDDATRVGLPEVKVGLFPGRRRHAARGAPDADRRRAADAVQGRADPSRHGAQHGPRPRRRARATRSSQAAKDWIKATAARRKAPWDQKGFKPAVQQGLFAAGMQIWPAGQRDLPPRDPRQLPGRPRHPARRSIEGLQLPDGPGAEGRVPLFRQDPAVEGSGGDDPHALRLHAGAEQGRAPAEGRAADEAQEDRRRRRRLHGRRHRLCHGAGRARGRAHRPRHGGGREGQGLFAQAHVRPDHEGPRQDRRPRRAARAHHAVGRLCRPQGLRPRHRGGVRGSEGQGRGDRRRSRPSIRPECIFASNTSTLPITGLAEDLPAARSTSSASISSRRSRR